MNHLPNVVMGIGGHGRGCNGMSRGGGHADEDTSVNACMIKELYGIDSIGRYDAS